MKILLPAVQSTISATWSPAGQLKLFFGLLLLRSRNCPLKAVRRFKVVVLRQEVVDDNVDNILC